MKFPLKRAGHSIGLILGLISLIICIIAPCATGISSASKNRLERKSLPGNVAAQQTANTHFNRAQIGEAFDKLPLRFEQNVGQFIKPIQFFSRGKGYELVLTNHEVVVKLEKAKERKWKVSEEVVGDCERLKLPPSAFCLAPSSSKSLPPNQRQQTTSTKVSTNNSLVNPADQPETSPAFVATATVKMKFIGGKATARVIGQDALTTKSNYFRGNNPKDWHTNVANFASLKYENLYHGIDAIFYGNQQNVEYDFVVAPQADAKLIRLGFEGANGIRINEQGDLILQTSAGEMRQHKPFAYQEVEGQRKEVICKYKLLQATSSHSAKVKTHSQKVADQLSAVGFTIGEYDKTLPIIIDPVLDFSTCLGGESDSGLGFNATDVAVDADENIYIVGYASYLPQFSSASKGVQTQAALNQPGIFVAKIDSINKRLVYYTTLTGTSPYNSFKGTGIAVDDAGNAYVTGSTTAPSFPTTQDAFQTGLRGNTNGFITKLSPEGNTLVYSTFLGAADNLNTGNVSQCNPQQFGNCITDANDIAIDAAGNAFVTGETSARSFPTTPNAFKPIKSDTDSASAVNPNGSPYTEAFVTKLNATGTSLIYSTFLGGNGNDSGNGIKLDASGNAYIVGTTAATDFPMQNALYGHFLGGTSDAFLSKLNPAGTTLLYSTYVGGISRDTGKALDIDAAGNVYLCGDTNSTNLPVTAGAFQSKPGNAHFYKSTNSGATWKPLLNGFDGDRGEIAIDPDNSANLFAGTSSGISQSTDGGESWQAPSNRQVNPFSYVTFAPQNPAVAFAMAYQANRGYILLRTTDKGSTWNEIAYPTLEGTSSRTFDLQIDPTNLSTLYLSYTFYSLTGTYQSRILKTTDAGVTWKYINEGFPSQTDPYLLGINPQNPSLLFAKADGLYRSKDGGNKWKPTDLVDGGISHISFNPANPSIVYAAGNKLYGSTDSGMTWKQIENNLTNRFPNYHKLLVTANNLYTLFTGQAFKSMDGGRVWANISPTSGLTDIRTLAVDPKNPATLYAGTQRFDNDGFVMKINVQASALSYCTYLSGESRESTSNIAIDDFGNAIVIGSTDSLTFPTQNALQAKPNYLTDAFVTKLTSTGGVIYSTYFGGNYDDMGGGVATDKSGRVYIVGTTTSNQFPKIAPLQPSVGNGASFIARITDLPAVYSPPAVFSVTPNLGAGAGQTRITIKGANFLQGATVSVGGTLSQETVVVDANTIQAIAQGAFSGQANIVVMNPDGQTGALEKAFNFLLTPLLRQVTVENNQLVLSGIVASPTGSGGYGFDSDAVLLVNGKEIKIDPPVTPEILRSKKALKKIQPGQTGQLQVRNGNGLLSNIFSFRRP
jgi:photosystem II stability/assembly factor-like uncharacterized protein